MDSYNGATSDATNAPGKKKITRLAAKDPSVLAKELEEERKRNASLMAKLKKAKTGNKRMDNSKGEGSFVRLHSSTRNESLADEHNSVLMASMSNLSFASLQVPECKPIDGEDDIDRKSYEQWKHILEASMQLAGVVDEATKMNIFRIKAGPKLLDILENTLSYPESPNAVLFPYANAVHRLGAFYGSRDYIFMQRQRLRSLAQKPGETDVKYVKRVMAVAKLCDFNEENLADQVADSIQSHALNLKVREAARKTLRKGGSLVELLERVRALEMEQLNEDMFAKNHRQPEQLEVAAVSYGSHATRVQNSGSGSSNRRAGVQQRLPGNWRSDRGRGYNRREYVRNSTVPRAPCWRCMSKQHQASECYAIDKICRRCNVKGHFERACHKSGIRANSSGPIKRRYSDEDSPNNSKKVAAVKEEDSGPMDVSSYITSPSIEIELTTNENTTMVTDVATGSPSDLKVKINEEERHDSMSEAISISKLGECSSQRSANNEIVLGMVAGVEISFLIDSGAEVNTVGGDVFDRLMSDDSSKLGMFCIQEGSDVPLKAYAAKDEIQVVATFVAELVISDDRPRLMEKFYAVRNARSLLGRSTAIRYSVLQIGLSVPIHPEQYTSYPGEIRSLSVVKEFPKFSVDPVVINYDKSMPPSRKIFTCIPPAFRSETDRRLKELLESDIIERVTNEMDRSYCSSLLVVPKGKHDIRLVVDLRGPNKAIIRTPFRMPTLESIMTDLPGSKWFSTIDLTSAFFHVVLDERSRHLTNFFAGDGMYRFKRLPFGLTNAPDIFQEILQTVVLEGCKGVRNYLDDIFVFGSTKEEHDENLKAVMERLKNHNVCINEEKSMFGQQSVKFLGFQLSDEGLSVEEDKLKAIREFRHPETQQEVKSFLGLMNFTERFIMSRAEKTQHLRDLAKSECFYWNDDLEKEFVFLKEDALKEISKLAYFDVQAVTELYVDASPTGLGAVLIQFSSEGVPRIISCASKVLTEAEKKYPHTQKEALAIVWGIERFTFYLTGKSFVVRTDSEANEFIFGDGIKTSKRSVTRAEAWALRLQAYDFAIKRIPGNMNIADALSRLISRSQVDEAFEEDDEKHLLYSIDIGAMNITWENIELESERDTQLIDVREAIATGDWPERYSRYATQSKELRVLGSLVFKNDKVILPSVLRSTAMADAHQGHIGSSAMKRILRDYFWWPGISTDVGNFVKKCETCIVMSRKNPPIPLSNRKLPEGPWEIMQVDFLTVQGCGHGEFMVLVDTYSRYISVIEMKSTDAKNTNEALQKVFFNWGLPLIIQSDNGPPFQSSEFVEFWENKGVKVRKSIPLCPQTNGAVERQNQGIIKALSAAKIEGVSWRKALEEYVHMHNTLKPHARLGITPFELLAGWKYRGTFPALWDAKSDKLDRDEVREKDAATKLQDKLYADGRRGAKASDIAVGDVVLMASHKKTKTDPTFSKERYTVISRDGAKVVVRSGQGVQYSRNVQDLKRAPTVDREAEPTDGVTEHHHVNDGETPMDSCSAENELRPRRTIRKPQKFKDMVAYHIFE